MLSPESREGWPGFLRNAALALACLLLASAAICWIAANWAEISVFQKLLGTQAVLAALVLLSRRLVCVSAAGAGAGTHRQFSVSAKLIGLAAVATGALLALIGQIYQTGADPWGLFLLWAALLVPWLLAMRTVFLALLCAALLNIAAALYLDVYLNDPWLGRLPAGAAMDVLLALLNFALLLIWEYGIGHLGDRWRIGPRVLGAAALSWLVASSLSSLSTIGVLALVAPELLLMAWIARIYTRKLPDPVMVSLAALAAFCQVASLLLRWQSGYELLLVILLLIGLAGWGLRRLATLFRPPQHTAVASDAAALGSDLAGLTQEPWYFTLLRLAVVMITAGLTTLFVFLVLDPRPGWIGVMGLLSAASGLGILHIRRNGIQHEFGMALAAAGLLLVGIDVLAMDHVDALIRTAAILAAGMLVYAFAASAALRLLSAAFVLGISLVLTWPGQNDYGLLDIFGPGHTGSIFQVYLRLWLFAVAAVLTWSLLTRSRQAAFWNPLAWSLVCLTQLLALMAPATAMLVSADSADLTLLIVRLACAALPVVVLAALLRMRGGVSPAWRHGAPAVLAVASLGWIGAPGVSMALSWIILGYGLARRSLLVFGALALPVYLGLYYYMLESSLLQKSWMLGLSGAWLFSAWLVSRAFNRPSLRAEAAPKDVGSGNRPSRRLRREAGLVFGLLLVLSVANTLIYQHEQILRTGQRVVLALAPVDPRSMMQGDYMALNFVVAEQWASALEQAPVGVADQIAAQRRGYLILRADERGVHQLVALKADLDDSAPAAGSEAIPLSFRLRRQGIHIVTDAWFFPEGQASRFEPARYGEFRVDAKGKGLLTGMLDAQRQLLP